MQAFAPASKAQAEPPAKSPASTDRSQETHALPAIRHDFSRIPIHPSPVAIQTKLTVNTPGDRYEREADRVAEQVMRMPEPRLQRTCACGGSCGGCQKAADDEHLQRKAVSPACGQALAPPTVNDVLRSPGQPLDDASRAFLEPRFGRAFSEVRVHTGALAERSARDVNAHAYTVGRDIVFGAGRFAPGTREGRLLIAHELTHVAQQTGRPDLPERGTSEVRLARQAAENLDEDDEEVEEELHGPILREVPPEKDDGDTYYKPSNFNAANDNDVSDPNDSDGIDSRGRDTVERDNDDYGEIPHSADEDKKDDEVSRLRGTLESKPIWEFNHGGVAPRFVTATRTEFYRVRRSDGLDDLEGSKIEFTPQEFHLLSAIDHDVALAETPQEDLALLLRYFPDLPRKIFDSPGVYPALPRGVTILPYFDPFNTPFNPDTLEPRLDEFVSALSGRKPRTQPQTAPAAALAPAVKPDPRKASRNRKFPCEAHLDLPYAKQLHLKLYEAEILGSRLAAFPTSIVDRLRTTAYERESNQVANWLNGMDPRKGGIMDPKVLERGTTLLAANRKCGKDRACIELQRNRFMKPDWTPSGAAKQMDVDHIIELQVGFIETLPKLDRFDNYELLDASTNSSAGATLDGALQAERRRLQQECPGQVPWDEVALVFALPVFQGGGKGPGERWTRAQIRRGDHLAAYRGKP